MIRTGPAIRLTALCLASGLATSSAQAEGLFDFLFGDSDSERAAPSAPMPGPGGGWQRRGPRDDPSRRQKNVDRGQGKSKRGDARMSELSGDGYCVRTCDGYYFPLIRSTRATGQQSCEFSCPSASVELFTGSSIETARNAKGQHYNSLPTAFSFRDKTTEKCACIDPNASSDYFLHLSRTDPTLRSGDVVVEDSGPFVYNGASLVTLGHASFLPTQIQQRLRAMLRKKDAEQAAAASPVRASQPAAPVSKPAQAQGSIEFGAPSATQ